VAGGVVYIGTYEGRVHALDAAAGTAVWSFAIGADVESSPAVADGALYIGSCDGNLYRFDTRLRP
jgi:outer membrane protein assembly factor BamB